jgi:enterochelin esterase-like enzyme
MCRFRFRHSDPDRSLSGVRLQQRIGLDPTEFTYDAAAGAWTLTAEQPAAWRVEYLLELLHPDGSVETVVDPNNPRRAPGAFGDKSVAECPEYTPPTWLDAPEAPGTWRELTVAAPRLDGEVAVRLWSPAAPTRRALVAHDGPEYDRLAGLGRFCATAVQGGRVPPFHLVLVAPGARNEWYSANPAYADTLTGAVLPRVAREVGPLDRPVGLGASLGALAMLHVQRRAPEAFAGLFLQSGSFFLPRLDPQERQFGQYQRIIRFVGSTIRSRGRPVPATFTCGLVEENLHNNRHMVCALREQGYPAVLAEVPDAHNFVAWRDAFDPHLVRLLTTVWSPAGAGDA